MGTTNCTECGRTNAAEARVCMWCGLPLHEPGSPISFETIRAEVNYLDGFERLDGPATMELAVSPTGVEIRELMPGTRSILIPVASIVGASVTGPLRTVGSHQRKGTSGWVKLTADDDSQQGRVALSLKCKLQGEDLTVIFEREDKTGLDALSRIARTINLLVRSCSTGPK
jgi:hypothetical protein